MNNENFFELKSANEWRYDYPYSIEFRDGSYHFANREGLPLYCRNKNSSYEFKKFELSTEQLEHISKVLNPNADGSFSYYYDNNPPWNNKHNANEYMLKVQKVRAIINSRETHV